MSVESQEYAEKICAYLMQPHDWESVKSDIYHIQQRAFDVEIVEERWLKPFQDPANTVVLLKDNDRVIGFTYAVPDEDNNQNAYVYSTAIHPDFQHRGLVGMLMEELEDCLRAKGYRTFDRDAARSNEYADNVLKHYKDRVLKWQDHESEFGPQRYIKIIL